MHDSFSLLPPYSRVWIFQTDRFLTDSECREIQLRLNEFIPNWASHGNGLNGGFKLEKNLFVIVGVDESQSMASGCSIDSLTRVIKELGMSLNVDFFNRLAIAYENQQGKLEIVSMTAFKALINSNQVNYDTIVFNNLVASKEEFDQKWRTNVGQSWHANLFQLA
ncbi:MAG: hypothetical protein IT222_07960 [Crocinitomix sp.]|nr:hypothetical protein [Crocinitomix sp.]